MSDTKTSTTNHKLSVSMGFTRNLGNFESFKMEVGLEVDGKPGEHPDKTFERASQWVEEKFMAEFKKVESQIT